MTKETLVIGSSRAFLDPWIRTQLPSLEFVLFTKSLGPVAEGSRFGLAVCDAIGLLWILGYLILVNAPGMWRLLWIRGGDNVD